VGTPEAHVRLPLGHRDSTQNEVHTEAGPNKLVQKITAFEGHGVNVRAITAPLTLYP